MAEIQKTVFVRIKGKVQGVSFRYYTAKQAVEQRVTGWVKNLADESVSAIFSGDVRRVDRMIEWCHQGPPLAEVTEVRIEEIDFQSFDSFEIIRS